MKFGICTSIDPPFAAAAKAAGWDYVEPSVQTILNGSVADEQWKGAEAASASDLPLSAANMLVPADLKITGPNASLPALRTYMERVARRARQVGIGVLVFGSGGARQVPDGFEREQAKRQIIDFARLCAELVGDGGGVTIVIEPLNRGECNIVNSVAEAMEIVRAVNHPSFQCLLDTYHSWLENEPLEEIESAVKSIRHVHVADKDGRVAPGESGTADYQPIFRLLRKHDYRGTISVEAKNFEPTAYFTVIEYLKGQWQRAGLD